MDAQPPLSGQPPLVAFGGTTLDGSSSKGMAPKRMPGKSKPKAKHSIAELGFEVCTPESYKQQIARKEKRNQYFGSAPREYQNNHKRTLDLTDDHSGQGSSKRAKTINGPYEAGVPGTDSGENVLTPLSTPARRNVGGRPRIHPVKEHSGKAVTFLRTNKPVSQKVFHDLWTGIFDFSSPEFLLRARQICSHFYQYLSSYQSQWKNARFYTYGFDHPDPPPGLTEMQYAELLTGVGCQTNGCNDKASRKVYWGFLRRWCSKCVETNTIRESDIVGVLEEYSCFRDCIPKVTFDSWNRYLWVGDPSQKPGWAQNAGTYIRYSRLALTRFIRDYDEFVTVTPDGKVKTEEEKKAWVDNRKQANGVQVEKLRLIEAYVETEKKGKKGRSGSTKAAREAFYKERALKMNPPLSGDALTKLKKYKAAIEIPKMPTERSWQELLPKLEEDRAKAEERIVTEFRIAANPDDNKRKKAEYQGMLENRKQHTTPEQRFVLNFAEKIINEVKKLVDAGSMAVVDFVPLIFRRIFEEYNSIHDTGKPGNYEGRPYRLVLDDARMIYDSLIAKAIDSWEDPAKAKAAKHLKCPGCKRKDSHRLHEFESLIIHIGSKHTTEVGTLDYFLPQPLTTPDRGSIPWCILEWPRNLPILASHREVVGEWNPDDHSDYVHAPSVVSRRLWDNAFTNRSVANGEYPPRGDFIKNVVHAASLLHLMPILDKFKTQIALKYALDRYNNSHKISGAHHIVPVQALKDLPTALFREGIRGLFEGFSCRACRANNAREKRHNKFADKRQSLGELIKHYLDVHENSSWSSSLFDLPSGEELMEALTTPRAKQAYETFAKLFPETGQVPGPATESSKAASLGTNLHRITHPAKHDGTAEQALVDAWKSALWTVGTPDPSSFGP